MNDKIKPRRICYCAKIFHDVSGLITKAQPMMRGHDIEGLRAGFLRGSSILHRGSNTFTNNG